MRKKERGGVRGMMMMMMMMMKLVYYAPVSSTAAHDAFQDIVKGREREKGGREREREIKIERGGTETENIERKRE